MAITKKGLVVVTGASSSIGNAVIEMCLAGGFDVLATVRPPTTPPSAGEGLRYIAADLLSAADADAVAARVTAVGPLAGLVHVAGSWVAGDIDQLNDLDFYRALQLNVGTAFNICKSLLPALKQHGCASIITVGSVLGISPVPNSLAYSSAKAALIQFTRALALDVASFGIRCNCICPGLIDTKQTNNVFSNPEWVGVISKSYPMGRLGRPSDVSRAVAFLLSDASRWMTGCIIPVDGGYLISPEVRG